MSGVFELGFEAAFTTSAAITVTHNLNREDIYFRVLVGGLVRQDLILSAMPTLGSEKTEFLVTLASAQTGVIQVLVTDFLPVALPTLFDSLRGGIGYNRGFSIFKSNAPYVDTTSTAYSSICQFSYPGSDALDVLPDTASALLGCSSNGGSMGVRVQDITNALTIAESDPITVNQAPANFVLGGFGNLPTGDAVFELQMKKISGTARAHFINVFTA